MDLSPVLPWGEGRPRRRRPLRAAIRRSRRSRLARTGNPANPDPTVLHPRASTCRPHKFDREVTRWRISTWHSGSKQHLVTMLYVCTAETIKSTRALGATRPALDIFGKRCTAMDKFHSAKQSGTAPSVLPRTCQCRLPARSGHPRACYSITESARSKIDCGILSPSALASFKLMTNSNLVGCWIGNSPGFAPSRIFAT